MKKIYWRNFGVLLCVLLFISKSKFGGGESLFLGEEKDGDRHVNEQLLVVDKNIGELSESLALVDSKENQDTPILGQNKDSTSLNTILKSLPDVEQESLWAAFSEARREVHEIAQHRRDLPENAGYDYYTFNPNNKLRVRFGERGVRFDLAVPVAEEGSDSLIDQVKPAGVNMNLVSVGGELINTASIPVKSSEDKTRVEYQHSSGVSEWYVNNKDGVEQGYTVVSRPDSVNDGEAVILEIALDGLSAHDVVDGTLSLQDGDDVVFEYSKLVVYDARGDILDSAMSVTPEGGILLSYYDEGAVYPVTVDPLITTEEEKLNRVYAERFDYFGHSVAISGDTALIGVYADGVLDAGSAYVFVRMSGSSSWSQQAKLTASDADIGDYFGFSVALSGDRALIGAYRDDAGNFSSTGSAYVFERSSGGTNWSEQAKLTASDPATSDFFGWSVALSGDTALIGAYGDDFGGASLTGSAYVFERSSGGSSWSQQAKLTASDIVPSAKFGHSVSLSGDTALIGAHGDYTLTGNAYIFERSSGGTSWVEQAKLTASDAEINSFFGVSVSLSGDTALIGAYYEESAYVFQRDSGGTNWVEQEKLTASDADAGYFGWSVALSGDTAIVGAYNGYNSRGSVYVFESNNGGVSWSEQVKLTASDGAITDRFGYSVAISGETALIGAFLDDDGATNSGSAYVFERISGGTSWNEVAKLTANDTSANDNFGGSVAISGDTALIGTGGDDEGGSGSGSAYVFVRSGSSWSQEAKLIASDAAEYDRFGGSVAISGDIALIGAHFDIDGGVHSGSAYVFVRIGTSWSQEAKLIASDAAASDSFGGSVAISGETALIGSSGDDDGGSSSGSAYVFVRTGGSWLQEAKLTASDAAAADFFGVSVAISGETALIGAYADDDVDLNSGSAYVFTRTGTSWGEEVKLTASDVSAYNYFGRTVALSGDTSFIGGMKGMYVFERTGSSWSQDAKLIASDAEFLDTVALAGDVALIGAKNDDHKGMSSGSAYVFVRNGSSWSEKAKLTASDAAEYDTFGNSVALSGDTALIGAHQDDDGGGSSGSVYIFRLEFGYLNVTQDAGLSGNNALPEADPFNRGIQNGVAYALGIPLTGPLTLEHYQQLPHFNSALSSNIKKLSLTLPLSMPDDVTLSIMQSCKLDGNDWTEIAKKVGDSAWTGTVNITSGTPVNNSINYLIENPNPVSIDPKSFMRLEITITE